MGFDQSLSFSQFFPDLPFLSKSILFEKMIQEESLSPPPLLLFGIAQIFLMCDLLSTRGYDCRENWPRLSQQLTAASSFPAKDETSCPTPLSMLELALACLGLMYALTTAVSS